MHSTPRLPLALLLACALGCSSEREDSVSGNAAVIDARAVAAPTTTPTPAPAAATPAPAGTPAPPATRATPTPAKREGLATRQWMLVELNGEPVESSQGEKPIGLEFLPGLGSVRGFAGVNEFHGKCVVDEGAGTIELGTVVTSQRMGPLVATERAYLEALGAARRLARGEGTLDLMDPRGKVVARFQAVQLAQGPLPPLRTWPAITP